jgi:PiT family inorganic phosphate transporter
MKFVGVLAGGIAAAYALIELLRPDVLSPAEGSPAATMLVALFASACFWNIATWWFGIPTSSSHCLGAPSGVAPATFMCVFVAARDKGATWLGSVGVSALLCVFGVLLFRSVLQTPMPVLKFLGRSLL